MKVKPRPFRHQLLKWVGNKQRFAHEISAYFPDSFGTYFEPFLGSGAVLATLAPTRAIASDTFAPLIAIFNQLRYEPETLKRWYAGRHELIASMGKKAAYAKVLASYNAAPNGADFVFLSRACYGGVIRFRKDDGYMSTPCGAHTPIAPASFNARVDAWQPRVAGATFLHEDYTAAFARAEAGDLIYCDPPYAFSQAILYGAQRFSLAELISEIAAAKERGVYVALSIDGSKKSGNLICDIEVPEGLFVRELSVNCGRSMLRRFQMPGQTLEQELVTDRLLLTYEPSAHA